MYFKQFLVRRSKQSGVADLDGRPKVWTVGQRIYPAMQRTPLRTSRGSDCAYHGKDSLQYSTNVPKLKGAGTGHLSNESFWDRGSHELRRSSSQPSHSPSPSRLPLMR